ncbi:hypothetical protein C7974DRAFT_183921 [Boeremia exigua]|uniref:uncharacterized protein n=1 Tax=Boeremia exigua TaxID=749465 RepID=UPI001E8EC97D|nr:uncharacterized protein C7974DRAFT_183921 [Boeremia exigua]KAH6629267.1 hypothetical protein C7974DRAFT_183921 [Boeremia exigua]
MGGFSQVGFFGGGRKGLRRLVTGGVMTTSVVRENSLQFLVCSLVLLVSSLRGLWGGGVCACKDPTSTAALSLALVLLLILIRTTSLHCDYGSQSACQPDSGFASGFASASASNTDTDTDTDTTTANKHRPTRRPQPTHTHAISAYPQHTSPEICAYVRASLQLCLVSDQYQY